MGDERSRNEREEHMPGRLKKKEQETSKRKWEADTGERVGEARRKRRKRETRQEWRIRALVYKSLNSQSALNHGSHD